MQLTSYRDYLNKERSKIKNKLLEPVAKEGSIIDMVKTTRNMLLSHVIAEGRQMIP